MRRVINLRRLFALGSAFLAFVCSDALGDDIGISIQADLLKDRFGVAAPQNCLILLVAIASTDTTESVFSIASTIPTGASSAVGSVLAGDDTIVYRGALSGFGSAGVLNTPLLSLNFASAANWGTGDRLALLWFPTLTVNDSSLPANATFGFYDGGVASAPNVSDGNSNGQDGSNDWVTPPLHTTTTNLLFYTKDGMDLNPFGANAANSASSGDAFGVVIPEPATGLLALLGAVGLLGRGAKPRRISRESTKASGLTPSA